MQLGCCLICWGNLVWSVEMAMKLPLVAIRSRHPPSANAVANVHSYEFMWVFIFQCEVTLHGNLVDNFDYLMVRAIERTLFK